ncbi:MAG: single-stranded DNA-binding protein, partial [Proteobacteria bacterium]|nr:single-stranded DNA-binding protein [Pseudomonadota bacterium]
MAGIQIRVMRLVRTHSIGRLAEIAGEYLRKGRPAYIEGRLKLDSWDDKQTGQKRSKMRVVGESLQLLGGREGG